MTFNSILHLLIFFVILDLLKEKRLQILNSNLSLY